jgi:hypothetical protein
MILGVIKIQLLVYLYNWIEVISLIFVVKEGERFSSFIFIYWFSGTMYLDTS